MKKTLIRTTKLGLETVGAALTSVDEPASITIVCHILVRSLTKSLGWSAGDIKTKIPRYTPPDGASRRTPRIAKVGLVIRVARGFEKSTRACIRL